MATSKCGGLKSQNEARNEKLTTTCKDPLQNWLKVWKLFSQDEFKWFKKNYPAKEMDAEEAGAEVHDKQAMQTLLEVNKKEVLCLTLFTIDDECVGYPHIRLFHS